MAGPKKYGTFGGVFTPSILTILGVIMYMRLSWVVGSSGSLVVAIGIILMAHIVSLTTGLSVSSVATDRKIKAGGIYYMLSRSLGLPIGGSIGVTLFIATALSIALYLIGFAESALVVLQEPFGIEEITINHLRIIGSAALFLIVMIAFISTSIAIKSQYFILGAIVLSIVSILMGTTEGKEFDLSNISQGTISFPVLFGIFFPAVTGFTAGVAMSGDLKNAKKSIPWGTMLAVVTGLIVYIGLAIFIYYSIDESILVSDKNALSKFGWMPNLVIAGIWGATLSSALGGILGAPRILQAMSVDGITPRVFEKGVGEENEPRNALILTFIIAEIGILIGELDVIAEVVAMFYMAAYLFINLSCLLEQWASPDFRPTFKISLAIPLIGALATFLLMIQLNLGAALMAILVMVLLFIWLTRKQLVLGSGDVWLSVWSSVVKMGLKNLDKKPAHKRNWEPNILLFSGGGANRDKLIQFSKSVAGKTGMISNFDLIENKTAKVLFPKHKQSLRDDELITQGVFSRKQECKDSYLGIETIASTYGFSGVEPNTVLLGWERSTVDSVRFAQLTQKLCELDYNVLYLDYDKDRGFGNYKQIDIWWSDFSNTTELTLNLVKFLNKSIDWRHAQIRILHVSDVAENKLKIESDINEIIESYRIKATVKVVNNEMDQKTIYDIMKIESYDADLIFVGIPSNLYNEQEFVNKTNELVSVLGTTLLVKASSSFEEVKVTDKEETVKEISDTGNEVYKEEEPFSLASIQGSLSDKQHLNEIANFNTRLVERLENTVFNQILEKYKNVLNNTELKLENISEEFDKYFSNAGNGNNIRLLREQKLAFLLEIIDLIKGYNEFAINEHKQILERELLSFNDRYKTYIKQLPKKVVRRISSRYLEKNKKDKFWDKRMKSWLRFKKKTFRLTPKVSIPFRDVVSYNYEHIYLKGFNNSVKQLNVFILKVSNEINTLVENFDEQYEQLRKSNGLTKAKHREIITSTKKSISEVNERWGMHYQEFLSGFKTLENEFVFTIKTDAEKLRVRNITEEKLENTSGAESHENIRVMKSFADTFTKNNVLINNHILLECSLFKIRPELNRVNYQVGTNVETFSIAPKISQIAEIERLHKTKDGVDNIDYKLELINYLNRLTEISIDNDELIDNTIKKVEKIVYKIMPVLEVMDNESANNFASIAGSGVKTVNIQLQKLMLFSIENKFVVAVNKESEKLEKHINEFIYDYKSKSKLVEAANFDNEEEEIEISEKILAEGILLVDKINTRYQNFISKLNTELEETYKILEFSFITGNVKIIDQYVKRTGSLASKGLERKLIQLTNRTKKIFKESLEFIDTQRDDYLMNDFKLKNEKNYNTVTRVTSFIRLIKNTKEADDKIPFFYKKIFIGDHAAPTKIENRETEIEEATGAVGLIKETGGAILVLGEKLAGKKYFSDYIASRIIKNESVTITPVITNNIIEACFNQSINNALGTSISLENYLDEMENLTIVFDDFEKWTISVSLVNRIKDIVEKFDNKHSFILNSSLPAHTFIKRFVDFENLITSTILIKPILKNDFIDALKLKHQAGGIKFILKGKEEREISPRRINILFQKYHILYKGNIGLASLAWINNIKGFDDERLYIVEPRSSFFPDIINNDWIIILRLLLLFGEVSEIELDRMLQDKIETRKVIAQMKRAKLLNEPESKVYEIIPEALYPVEEYLRDKKIIA